MDAERPRLFRQCTSISVSNLRSDPTDAEV